MPDQPDETHKQQRRSAVAPPFFAPRTPRPTTPSQSTAATPRRTPQLFTPPGVPKQPRPAPFKTPLATPRVTPFAAPVVAPPPAVDALPEQPPPLPPAEATEPPAVPAAATDTRPLGDGFVIEQYESPPISLHATGEQGVVSDDPSMSFQVYDDASRLLERGARPVPPDAGGLEIERTEVTFDAPDSNPAPLQVESFWAAAPTPASASSAEAATPPLGNKPVPAAPADEGPAGHEPPPLPRIEAAEAAPAPPAELEPIPVPSWLDEAPLEPAYAEPSSAQAPISEAASDIPPLPELPAAANPEPQLPSAPDDADEALAEAFAEPAPNESVPRWATPRAMRAVEESEAAPTDPWGMPPVPAPPDELAAALAWPDSGLRVRTPAMGVAAQGAGSDRSHELAASAEGWPLSVAGGPGVPDAVASALERIAQRVRSGDVPLPADVALAKSDESALALTLAALLRTSPTPRA